MQWKLNTALDDLSHNGHGEGCGCTKAAGGMGEGRDGRDGGT